jgi:hypothetical protein
MIDHFHILCEAVAEPGGLSPLETFEPPGEIFKRGFFLIQTCIGSCSEMFQVKETLFLTQSFNFFGFGRYCIFLNAPYPMSPFSVLKTCILFTKNVKNNRYFAWKVEKMQPVSGFSENHVLQQKLGVFFYFSLNSMIDQTQTFL